MGLCLQGKIIHDCSINGARRKINRGGLGQSNVDSAAVRGKSVGAASGAIALVGDIAAGGADFYTGTGDVDELHRAAAGGDLHMANGDVGQGDGSGNAADVHMSCGDVAYERV